jgi:hypothetical protein
MGADRDSTSARDGRNRGRTPAQWYCYLVGATLALVGILGFTADASFDTSASADSDAAAANGGGMLQGDGFLGFEVNGWHNVVHLLSGIVLLALAGKRRTARPAAIAFGVVYGLVTVIGLIDGNDVLGLIPVNPADNVLHALLSVLGMAAGLMSKGDDHDRGEHRSGDRGAGQDARDATRAGADGARVERSGSDSQVVAPTDGNGGAGREGVRARR